MDCENKKMLEILEISLRNSIHTKKRLNSNNLFSKFVLSYYSIFLIILTITVKYFSGSNKDLAEYFGLIISIVLLVFSLVNSNSNYDIRVMKLNKSINELKTLKRENLSEDNLRNKYNEIVDNTEMRNDLDFYRTVKELHYEKGMGRFDFYLDYESGSSDSKFYDKLKGYRNSLTLIYFLIIRAIITMLRFIIILTPIIISIYIFYNKSEKNTENELKNKIYIESNYKNTNLIVDDKKRALKVT